LKNATSIGGQSQKSLNINAILKNTLSIQLKYLTITIIVNTVHTPIIFKRKMSNCHSECCNHNNHTHDVSNNGIGILCIAFVINMLLTLIEIGAGIFAGSVSLVGDGLHNTSDAFSILISIIAYKIGTKKANEEFSFGYKRAETIGGFINLILLFVSGTYLLFEGIIKIFKPEIVNGKLIIITSIFALIIDIATAKISHQHSHNNSNMKMLFLHNLMDALGSIGVIVSGIFVICFNWYFIDGLIAIFIATYMLIQAVMIFPDIVRILMNAMPKGFDINNVKGEILKINEIEDVHHLHVWSMNENELSFEGHIVSQNTDIASKVLKVLEGFNIKHSNIQIEKEKCKNV
jgi:cobalt-zinc-cadmium efflux system protein